MDFTTTPSKRPCATPSAACWPAYDTSETPSCGDQAGPGLGREDVAASSPRWASSGLPFAEEDGGMGAVRPRSRSSPRRSGGSSRPSRSSRPSCWPVAWSPRRARPSSAPRSWRRSRAARSASAHTELGSLGVTRRHGSSTATAGRSTASRSRCSAALAPTCSSWAPPSTAAPDCSSSPRPAASRARAMPRSTAAAPPASPSSRPPADAARRPTPAPTWSHAGSGRGPDRVRPRVARRDGDRAAYDDGVPQDPQAVRRTAHDLPGADVPGGRHVRLARAGPQHALLGDARAARRRRRDAAEAASRAKLQVSKAGRHIGQEAIQLHGGIGMTVEYSVGHYMSRLTAIDHALGDGRHHTAALARAWASTGCWNPFPSCKFVCPAGLR